MRRYAGGRTIIPLAPNFLIYWCEHPYSRPRNIVAVTDSFQLTPGARIDKASRPGPGIVLATDSHWDPQNQRRCPMAGTQAVT